jgi:MFS family permease
VENFLRVLLFPGTRFLRLFLISFVLAFFVRDWNLTYGQSALILLSSGVASVPAGYFFGWLGDKIGRRKVFMITILTFSLATGQTYPHVSVAGQPEVESKFPPLQCVETNSDATRCSTRIAYLGDPGDHRR